MVVGAGAVVEAEAVEIVGEGGRQAIGVQRQLEVARREIRHLVGPEQQLLAGGVGQRDVGALLGHRPPHLGEGRKARVRQARLVDAGLEIGDGVAAAPCLHDEGVGGRPAGQDVVPRAPVQRLDAGEPGQDVVLAVALAVGAVVGEGEVLHIGAQRVRHGRQDGVDALAGVLDRNVVDVIDVVAVVALAADQGVPAAVSAEAVVGQRAGQGFGRLGSKHAMRRGAADGQLNARGVRQILHCHFGFPLSFTEGAPRAGLLSAGDRSSPSSRVKNDRS